MKRAQVKTMHRTTWKKIMEDNARQMIKMTKNEDIIETKIKTKIKTTKANSRKFKINIKGEC
jgi:hypothetical protein